MNKKYDACIDHKKFNANLEILFQNLVIKVD